MTLQMVSCTLSSYFRSKRWPSQSTLMLGCQHMLLQQGWNAGPSQGHVWLPSLYCWRGRQPFFESVHPPAIYSISADSIFSVHFKCLFQQKPCRISATDPTAGCPGGFCPFPVRKDVLGMESSCGAHQWPRVPHAHPADCCRTGGVAADCCLLLRKSSFLYLAAGLFCFFSSLPKLVGA